MRFRTPKPRRPTGSIEGMEISVDFDACSSNAMCMGVAPELFNVGDDGFLTVLNEHVEGELLDVARLAVSVCPNQAISLIEG